MIAGLDNGLEKLNYVSIYPVVQFVKKNPLALAQFKDIIKDINTNGKWETYSAFVEQPSTGVSGDANSDGKFNIMDLIRMKKNMSKK